MSRCSYIFENEVDINDYKYSVDFLNYKLIDISFSLKSTNKEEIYNGIKEYYRPDQLNKEKFDSFIKNHFTQMGNNICFKPTLVQDYVSIGYTFENDLKDYNNSKDLLELAKKEIGSGYNEDFVKKVLLKAYLLNLLPCDKTYCKDIQTSKTLELLRGYDNFAISIENCLDNIDQKLKDMEIYQKCFDYTTNEFLRILNINKVSDLYKYDGYKLLAIFSLDYHNFIDYLESLGSIKVKNVSFNTYKFLDLLNNKQRYVFESLTDINYKYKTDEELMKELNLDEDSYSDLLVDIDHAFEPKIRIIELYALALFHLIRKPYISLDDLYRIGTNKDDTYAYTCLIRFYNPCYKRIKANEDNPSLYDSELISEGKVSKILSKLVHK